MKFSNYNGIAVVGVDGLWPASDMRVPFYISKLLQLIFG